MSKWLDAGAYDVVIGERHREPLDRRPLPPHLIRPGWDKPGPVQNRRMTGLDSLLYEYLKVCPAGPVADDAASLLMEILSREQDASFIEANGLKEMVYPEL